MNELQKYTCIVCPKSCDITLSEENGELCVSGNGCPRGKKYVIQEHTHPMRTITTTVKVIGSHQRRVGVYGSCEVPKEKLMESLKYLYGISIKAPVKAGDVIVSDILGTGCDIMASMDVPGIEETIKKEV